MCMSAIIETYVLQSKKPDPRVAYFKQAYPIQCGSKEAYYKG